MKLQIIKIFFKSIFFFIKHIILFILLNLVTYYLFDKFFFNVLDNFFTIKLSTFINGQYINPITIFMTFLFITKLITKFSFYTIAINNDIEDVKNDITIYIGEFFMNIFYIFTSGYTFVFVGILACIPVVTGIFYINFSIFFMIYAIIKRKNSSGDRYSSFESISKSFSITKYNKIKLLFFNTIIISFCVFLIYYMPQEIIFNNFNISYLLKIFITDFLIVYLLKIGFELDKIDSIRLEEEDKKEKENQYKTMRARSDF